MFKLSGVNYEEVLEQGDSILVRVIACSSYRGFELSGVRVIGGSSYRDYTVFEKVVEPILLHNCEITQAFIPKNWTYSKFKDNIWIQDDQIG